MAHRVPSTTSRCSSAAASSLGANIAVTSSSVISLSKTAGRRRPPVDALQRRQVGAEPVEQRAHRGFVGGVGGHRDEVTSPLRQGFRPVRAGAEPGLRDTATMVLAPISAELADQVRPDVSGGPDDQLAGVGVQRDRASRWVTRRCSRGTWRPRTGRRPGLHRRCARLLRPPCGRPPGRHRPSKSTTPPQISGCSRASVRPRPHSTPWLGLARSPSPTGWALRVTDEQLRRHTAVGHRRGKPAHLVEQLVGRPTSNGSPGAARCVQHVVDTASASAIAVGSAPRPAAATRLSVAARSGRRARDRSRRPAPESAITSHGSRRLLGSRAFTGPATPAGRTTPTGSARRERPNAV